MCRLRSTLTSATQGDHLLQLYKSQIPVIEQAIETAALMLGTDKSRGCCLGMICADFLAGANLEKRQFTCPAPIDPAALQVLPRRRKKFLDQFAEKAS